MPRARAAALGWTGTPHRVAASGKQPAETDRDRVHNGIGLRAAWSRPQRDQMERLMPVAEAGQDLRALSLDGLKRSRIESEQLQDRRRDLGRFHRVA